MVKVALYVRMDKYSMQVKKYVNALNHPFSMDIHVSKWMPAPTVKFGMCLSIHANAQISHGGMDTNVYRFLNAKEVKH